MGESEPKTTAEKVREEQLADELRKIIQRGRRINDARRKLRRCYDEWCRSNEVTIETLTELKDNILTGNTFANAAAGIGYFTEIFGGVLCIAGAIADQRSLIDTGNKISKGGNRINLGTAAAKSVWLHNVCDRAKKSFNDNEERSKVFEEQRYSYFQQLESFKRELGSLDASNSFPLLLEMAQREGLDFLWDLDLDDDAKSKLRTNLRQMCRSNSKQLGPTTMNVVGGVFATAIRELLHEFKELLDENYFLSSVFSEHTKKFLGEKLNSFIPCSDTVESYLRPFCRMELIQAGATMAMSRPSSLANRTEVGLSSSVNVICSFANLILRIKDIESGSKSQESEELEERIEEMKRTRENITEEMNKIFGSRKPPSTKNYPVPSLE